MNSQELMTWLRAQKDTLDQIIASAAKKFYEQHRDLPNYQYDLKKCQEESYGLVKDKDLCYDRLNTAFCYSLWYQPRRINAFLSHFSDVLKSLQHQNTTIYDLGAGTGAVQWAIGLAFHKLKEQGGAMPSVRIVNVDSSPLMIHYNQQYLWPMFCERYVNCLDLDVEYSVNSWTSDVLLHPGNRWITASYLFDVSDAEVKSTDENEYHLDLIGRFKRILDDYKPSKLLLLTSDQEKKRSLMSRVATVATKHGYIITTRNASNVFYGALEHTNRYRMEIADRYDALGLSNRAQWDEKSCSSLSMERRQTEISFGNSASSKSESQIRLYTEPVRKRRAVILNEEQIRAARHSDRPTIINGPAGSGKSIVLTERIKNLVEGREYDPTLRILLTTFNLGLRNQLLDWIDEILDKDKCRKITIRDEATFRFHGSIIDNIRVVNFDRLPTRIGNCKYEPVPTVPDFKLIFAKQIPDRDRLSNPKLFNADYLWDEYTRVVYGLQAGTEEKYLRVERRGRPRLNRYSNNRKRIWQVIQSFLANKGTDTFYCRRDRLLSDLRAGKVHHPKFTHVFVDEYQDLAPADYQILYELLVDPNNLVISGDASQAVHLGRFAEIPRSTSPAMQRREIIHLSGSYRLPHRLSECLAPLSVELSRSRFDEHEHLNAISPQKNAPPGARPIIVYASDSQSMGKKLRDVFAIYKLYDVNKATILEQDDELNDVLRNIMHSDSTAIETNSVLKVKGLEKPCVVWSTRKDIENKGEINEYVYTILSRSCKILVIALFPETLAKYRKAISLLRRDRLIFWDDETEKYHGEICESVDTNTPFYEETSDE